MGKAKEYVNNIYKEFNKSGYSVRHFLLNSSVMGVPQKRERVFFIAIRNDLVDKLPLEYSLFDKYPIIDLRFNYEKIVFGDIIDIFDTDSRKLTKHDIGIYKKREVGDIGFEDIMGRCFNRPSSRFNSKFLYKEKVSNTIMGKDECVLFDIPRRRSNDELIKCSSFPCDYKFISNKVQYVVGMSVPPVMMANIADRIYNQWLINLK